MAQSLRASLLTEISSLFGDVSQPKAVQRPFQISYSPPDLKVKSIELNKSTVDVKNSDKGLKERLKYDCAEYNNESDIITNNRTCTSFNVNKNDNQNIKTPSLSIYDSFESRFENDFDNFEKPPSSTEHSTVTYVKSEDYNVVKVSSTGPFGFKSRFENDSDFETGGSHFDFEKSDGKDEVRWQQNEKDPKVMVDVETIEPQDPLEVLSEELIQKDIKSELIDTKEGIIKEEHLYDSNDGDYQDIEVEGKPKAQIVLVGEDFTEGLQQSKSQIQSNRQKRILRKRMCYICKAKFKTSQLLQCHLKIKHDILDIEFKTRQSHYRKCYPKRDMSRAESKRRNKVPRKCSVCSITLIGESRLKYHLVRFHNFELKEFNLKCKYCTLTFDNKSTLDVHIRRKHSRNQKNMEKQVFACNFCRMVFENKEQLGQHKPVHSEGDEEIHGNNVHCGICNAVFNDMNQVRLHMNRKHNCFKSDFKFKCGVCDLSYDKENSLRYHQIRVHVKRKSAKKTIKDDSNQMLVCDYCNSTFVTKINLLKHLTVVHNKSNNENQFYYCEICDEMCSSALTLKRHKRSKHSEVNDYKCVECGHVLNNKDSYRAHFRRVHLKKSNSITTLDTGKEQMICEICSCIFKGPTRVIVMKKLQKHMLTHTTQKVDKSVICRYCGDIYTGSQVRKHMRTAHKDIFLRCKCIQCPYETHNERLLNIHIYKKHEREQNLYTCTHEDCRYSSAEKSLINVHVTRKHTVRPRLICNKCDFSTLNKYYLRDHLREHETGVKSYKCTKCPYGTNSSNSLTQHSYIHLTEKKYHCDKCDYKAKYSTQLCMHKIKHKSGDDVKMYKCRECPFETRYRNSLTSHSEKHGEEKYLCGLCPFKTRFNKQYQTHLKRHALIAELENK